jgi:glycosyltransferase involved in cell wall biosynthesis
LFESHNELMLRRSVALDISVPKFSIILPTCNRRSMLPRAHASVLAQTYDDFELLIVVDGSSPEYAKFAASLADDRVRVLQRSENGGPAQARNTAIYQATGELIAFLDDDDEYAPCFLESSLRAIERADVRDAITWCSSVMMEYSRDNNLASVCTIRRLANCYSGEQERLRAFLKVGVGSGVTIRASALHAVGLFDSSLKVVEDSDLFLRLLQYGCAPIPVPEVGITIHNHHFSRLTDATHHRTRIQECGWLIDRYRDWFDRYPRVLRQFQDHMELLQRDLDQRERDTV